MTADETIHLYALIALRALADYDPYEFLRSTDLSRRQIDERIDSMLFTVRRVENDVFAADVTQKLNDLRAVESAAEGPVAMSYLVRQIGNSSLERAYQLALTQSRKGEFRSATAERVYSRQTSPSHTHAGGLEPDFLRLGVMRLLRDLPNYEPRFGYRSHNLVIDCFLEPMAEGQPPILIEAKLELHSLAASKSAVAQLKKIATGWGRSMLVAVLTTSVYQDAREYFLAQARGKFFILAFDSEANEFDPSDREIFIDAVFSRTLV